jgi:hypothetical protein
VHAIVDSLSRWIELSLPCPLPEVWQRATDKLLFDNVQCNDSCMTHTLSKVSGHREEVQSVLGLELPISWWDNFESANVIHESLKFMCGSWYCGTPTPKRISGMHNLSLGSVYLISLLAYNAAQGNILIPTNDIKDLSQYPKLKNSFLRIQSEETAKNTAKALFYFFRNIFRIEAKHDHAHLENVYLDYDGAEIKFIFSKKWNLEGFCRNVVTIYSDYSKKGVSLIDLDESSWSDKAPLAFVSLLQGMLHNKNGIGSPGNVEFAIDPLGDGSPILYLRS